MVSTNGRCGKDSPEDLTQVEGSGSGLIGGDFNVTLLMDDRPGGRGRSRMIVVEFADFVALHGLLDLLPTSCAFTWRRAEIQN
jgi:hypothetical protein